MTKALAIIAALLLCALGWQWGRAEHANGLMKTAQGERDAAQQAQRQEADARKTESAQAHRLQEALDAEHLARLAVEDAGRRADAAAGSLRERAQQLAAAARCPAAQAGPAASSPAASAPADLLADMLGRSDAAAGELARYADQARLAGQLCERTYDALTPSH